MRSKVSTHTFHTQLNKDSNQLCTPPPKIAEEEQTLPCNELHVSDWHNWILPHAKLLLQ